MDMVVLHLQHQILVNLEVRNDTIDRLGGVPSLIGTVSVVLTIDLEQGVQGTPTVAYQPSALPSP